MRVSTLCAVSCVLLLASASAVSALVSDCSLFNLGLFRANVGSPDTPVVQVPPFTTFGQPLGFSPFYNQRATTSAEIVNPSPLVGAPVFNIIPVTTPSAGIYNGISNQRLFINISIGVGSTAPFFPNITISFNGVYLLGSSFTNFISTSAGSGVVGIFEVTNLIANANNSLVINATGNVNSAGGTATCGRLYYINISNPNVTTSIVGDPQFMGLRGQNFQVHGIDGAVYNIISDKQAQVNSRFVFLNGPRACPVMPSTGKKSAACWSHPGSYLGEIGIVTSGGDRIFIQSGAAASGFATVTLNDEPMAINDAATLSYSGSKDTTEVHYVSSHEMYVQAGPFIIEFENIDSFLNLRSVSVSGSMSKLASHGLLGQTWQNKRYTSSLKVIQGEVDDYVLADDDIFGTQFLYNQFSL